MGRLQEDLRAAVDAYLAATKEWIDEPGVELDETARRRLLAATHGQRILRRLRTELSSLHPSFDRATATAPDIVLTQPAHELWMSGSAALEAALRHEPTDGGLAEIRALLGQLEEELSATRES